MNLIICATPFQVLVAEKIIEHFADEAFYGVMLMAADNPKYRYYGQRLLDKCGGNGWIYSQKKARAKMWAVWDLCVLKCKGLQLGRADKLFLSSLDAITVQTLISGLSFQTLYTFDDGTANIVPDSYYYTHDRHQGLAFRLLKTVLGNPYDLARLKAQSQTHFTVYRMKNVFPNTHYLPLYAAEAVAADVQAVEEERIFIGQPIYEMQPDWSAKKANEANAALVGRIVRDYAIGFYLPHPRETYRIEGVAYLETEQVAEDFFARRFSGSKRYVLYGFCSGAVMPFIGRDNVRVVCLLPDDCPPRLRAAYDLMAQLGAEIVPCRGV